ncbi:EAL domain-containing protein [Sphingosinicella sp. BN140058]|uniref:bifunctional diguanylate cyclase/phosphodiesterase n=1 Tax=Sphingosinicella sp. BN140058 TaxID=1892855 RepID=UPI001FB12E88|nr:EAL domain-containing protein [Sphingosinicella sp. BN140058]
MAGLVSGFGIWATHFVAMLGYDPGMIVGFAMPSTAASLVVAILSTTIGSSLALDGGSLRRSWLAAAAFGAGIAAMHYLGMQAVELAGSFRWSAPLVLVSIVFAIVPTRYALGCAVERASAASALAASLLLVTAILMLHFTGMAAISVVPDPVQVSDETLLSPLSLGMVVAGAAFVVLTLALLVSLFSARTRSAIAASEREFRVLVQGISDHALYMLDDVGNVVSWNAGAERLKGYTVGEACRLNLADFYSSDDRAAGLPTASLAAARGSGKFNGEGWRYRKDGSRFWAHVTIEAVHDERGAFRGFAKITRDMTRFKEDQDHLRALTQNLDAALSNMHQGLCLFGADEKLVIANARAGHLFGVTKEDCPAGTPFALLLRAGLEKRCGGAVTDTRMAEVLSRHRECIAQPGGGTLVVQLAEDCILSIAHRPMEEGGWVTTFDDITERRLAEMRIEHMALHDNLTGLPNRVHFVEKLDAAVLRAASEGGQVAVIGIDLDRFKEVNDAHGHATGDRVLRILADRFGRAISGEEMVARFGGDEFAAMKPFADDVALADFLERLEQALGEPIALDAVVVNPGASLGVAIYPQDGSTCEQIVNNADLAMYRAKVTLGAQVCYYEPGMDEAARARRVLANDLREAIARNELSLAFQVQKDVPTERVTGYEALLRWKHPRQGSISPAEFIPIAEESGEIVKIGAWTLREACKQAARWPEPWRVAVNLSPIQLMHVDLVTTVTEALVESRLPARRLELEITETAIVSDKARALHILRQIKALGVTIAIDDFGTGYSSLDTLNSFPFDKIKIDKSFLIESEGSEQARAIIRAVLALGRSLAVPVLAEGLESAEQLRLLRAEGCDEAQGFYWGRPHSGPGDLRSLPRGAEEAA